LTAIPVGIYVRDGSEAVAASARAVRAHTAYRVEPVVLAADTQAATTRDASPWDVPILRGSELQRGVASWLHCLVSSSTSDVVVILEAGSVPGPAWLERLLAPLYADSENGLAGPSTNFSWNEQCVFLGMGGTLADVARTAEAARLRFGQRWHVLQPRRGLSEFCLAVRREVVDAIGSDNGTGPSTLSWDTDYAVRAGRAGFNNVWACSAYVWRSPSIARRKCEESRQLRPGRPRMPDRLWAVTNPGEQAKQPGSVLRIWPSVHVQGPDSPPLVSCIMPTRNRRDSVLQSICYFDRQDYPNRELILIDDGTDNLVDALPLNSGIRYARVPAGSSIGAKRNKACALARGTVIAQWDDDDWYAPNRLSAQVAPLLAGQAEITGLKGQVFFDVPHWRFWTCLPALHKRIFVEDVMGGTLVYTRACWEYLSRYPDCSLAEDAAFLAQAVARGARLKAVPDSGLFMYVRHEGNSWQFECGTFVDPSGWAEVSEPEFLQRDRGFYVSRSNTPFAAQLGGPFVSCIMPTADRRRFVPGAIQHFLRQTYSNRELLIIDDGEDNIADLVPASHQVRHIRLDRRHSIGAKRNLGCEVAHGDIIAHWDDDDWIANWRLAYQVDALLAHQSPTVCGLSTVYFFEPATGKAWIYSDTVAHGAWVAGGTLCYHKSLWGLQGFADVSVGEDARFIASLPSRTVLRLKDSRFYVGTVHSGNTSRKVTAGPGWHPIAPSHIRSVLGSDWASYQYSDEQVRVS
jgi:glycosyltransferase involved in cell wall biosynthesis